MNEKRRVLLVAHQYWPTPGSASQVMGALVRELVERHYAVTVLTNKSEDDDRPKRQIGPHGESVIAVAGPERSGVSLRRILDLAEFALGVMSEARGHPADIVVSDAPPTSAAAASRVARRKGVPFVYYFSDSWGAASEGSRSLIGRLLNWTISSIENRALMRSRLTVAVTAEMSNIARRAGSSKIIEVHNGIDTHELSDSTETWSVEDGVPFFLYAGNAGVVHGAEVFVDAAEILWRAGFVFNLVFMGYGVGHTQARAAQERWPGRVHVLGNQPTETVAAAYRGAAGALSSLKPLPAYEHARPMKTMTGAACGTPAVYAGAGEFADFVREHALGFVVRWNADEAAVAMQNALLLDSSPNRQAVRDRIRRTAGQYFDERAGAGRIVDEVIKVVRDPSPDSRK